MPGLALITGASSGIGAELARCFARNRHDLILTARNQPALLKLAAELESQHHVRCTVLPADLSDPASAASLHQAVRKGGHKVDILVNNAGLGLHGKFHVVPVDQHQALMQVNVMSVMKLTWLFVQDFLQAGGGKVLNVASIAAFTPGPLVSTYYASKACVVSWSLALEHELRKSNITVTTLCPGSTRTEFFERAGMADVRLAQGRWIKQATAASVAEAGYQGVMQGRGLVIPGWMNKLTAWVTRLSPLGLRTRIAANINRRSH